VVVELALFVNEPFAFITAADKLVDGDHVGVAAVKLAGVVAPAGPAVRIVSAATAPTIPAVTQR